MEIKLEKNTPAYELAKELAKKLPELDPDKNMALVTSKKVNITVGGLVTQMKAAVGQNTAQITAMSADRLKNFLHMNAEKMAERQLLLREAEKAGINVPQAKLDSSMNNIYQRSGGEEAFVKRIQGGGLTIDFVKKDVMEGLIVSAFMDAKVYPPPTVSDEEVQASYNEGKTVSVQHILLKTQGMSDSAKAVVKKTMEGLLERAKKGEDFTALAKQYSEDPGSKDKGGLYENFGRGEMVKPFEDAAFTVPVGGISDLVETAYGYHILKVVDRKMETRPFAEVRAELHDQLLNQKQRQDSRQRNQAINDFITQLKKNNDLKVAI